MAVVLSHVKDGRPVDVFQRHGRSVLLSSFFPSINDMPKANRSGQLCVCVISKDGSVDKSIPASARHLSPLEQ